MIYLLQMMLVFHNNNAIFFKNKEPLAKMMKELGVLTQHMLISDPRPRVRQGWLTQDLSHT